MLRKYGVFLGLAILLSACQPSPTFLNPASPISEHEATLYREVLIEAVSIFVFITGILIWILIRDRSRGDKKLIPPQIHGKAIWAIVPIIAIVALDGMDFIWMIATANELHIPVGTTVQVSLKSVDVIHSFWIPQLSGKTDVIPGQHNTMWLTGDQVGEFLGQCAEFCGTEHAMMRFKVFVDSQADFDAWVANQQQPAYQPQTEDEQAGYKEVTGTCASCHSIDPSEMNTDKVGPNLTHLFSRTSFAGGTYDLNEENLRSWLHDTQALKPGNDMEITIPAKQLDQIVAYLTHLR